MTENAGLDHTGLDEGDLQAAALAG